MKLSNNHYNRYLKRWKTQFGIYADLMKVSLALVAEINPGGLTLLAYNSLGDNNIFFNKDIGSSICKSIINSCEPQHINNLQQTENSASLEAQAGLKCFYGTPILDDKGNVFAVLCSYSKEISVISEENSLHIENIKMLIEEDIFYLNNETRKSPAQPAFLSNDNQKLKHFLQFSPVGIFYYDNHLTITDFNDKLAEILKSSTSVILGLNMNNIYDKRVIPALQNALLGIEGEYEGEYNTTSSNTTLTLLMKTAPVFVNNKITGGIAVIQDISIKTNITKALAASETKYKELVEKINDVIYSINTQGVFTYVSPVIKLLTGYSPDEVMGYSVTDFIHKKHWDVYYKTIKEVEGGLTVQSEMKIKDKSGQYHWIRNSMRPIYDENGIFAGIHGIAQDIEYTKHAEISLRKSEEKFRLMATHISDIIYEWNPNTDDLIWYGNPSFISSKLSDIKKHADFSALIYRTDKAKVNTLWQNSQKDGKAWKTEFKIVCDKEDIYLMGSGLVLFENHKPDKCFGTLTNISNQKQLVQRLKLSNEKLEQNIAKTNSLLSVIPDLMFVFSRDGFITDYHYNNEDELFKDPSNFLNLNIKDVLPKDISDLTFEKIKQVLAKKQIETYKYQLKIKGKMQTYESRMVYYNIDHTLAIVRDVTASEVAEKELIGAKEKAEESDRLKSSFLANMSHEIRTPMNGIIGFSELLSAKTINPEEREYYTSIIAKSGHQLLDIINDVLEISKIETGQISINNAHVNLHYLIDVQYSFFKKKAADKSLELDAYKASNKSILYVLTDEGKLRQVLNNLISNAIKFTSSGKVSFGYSFVDESIVFCVEDEGIGIASDEQEKIFDRFTQANAKIMAQHGGTGLGLSISKSLVELLGGKIWVESELNKGSKFCFSIPYHKIE